MNSGRFVSIRGATLGLLISIVTPAVHGQSLLQTKGRVVAMSGQPVPGLGGGLTYSFLTGYPSLDDSGALTFGIRVNDPSAQGPDTEWLFHGSGPSTLTLVARTGDAAFGIANTTLLLDGGQEGHVGPIASPNGLIFWDCRLVWQPFIFEESAAIFGGRAGDVSLIARQGQLLSGAGAGSILFYFPDGNAAKYKSINRSGHTAFLGNVANVSGSGPLGWGVVGGPQGALRSIVTPGESLPGGAVYASPMGRPQINDSGQVLHGCYLMNGMGTPPATASDMLAVFVWNPTSGNSTVVRMGSPVPGMPPGNTFSSGPGSWYGAWYPFIGANAFNRAGNTALALDIDGPNVVPGIDDWAVFVGGSSGLTMTSVRRGMIAPGTTAEFDLICPYSLSLNNSGQIAFMAHLRGPGLTPLNSCGIWSGPPNALSLVARGGDACPGTIGATLYPTDGVPFFTTVHLNERGQVLFRVLTEGGDTIQGNNDEAMLMHDPAAGLSLVVRLGDSIATSGPPLLVGQLLLQKGNNGDANPLCFNRDGRIAFAVYGAHVVIDTRANVREYCFGDGLDQTHVSQCPCGNNGAKENGCANSANPLGAHLRSSGIQARDDMALHTEGTPSTSPVVYFQGTGLQDTVFGDGVACVGGTLQRLAVVISLAGRSSFPTTPQTSSLASAGGVTVGSGVTRRYQAVYRDSTVAFCQAGTFNTTNGVEIDW